MLSMWPGGVQPKTSPPEILLKNGNVVLACETDGASMVYQVDGEGYNADHWLLYTGPLKLEQGKTVSVIAHRIGYAESEPVNFVVPGPFAHKVIEK